MDKLSESGIGPHDDVLSFTEDLRQTNGDVELIRACVSKVLQKGVLRFSAIRKVGDTYEIYRYASPNFVLYGHPLKRLAERKPELSALNSNTLSEGVVLYVSCRLHELQALIDSKKVHRGYILKKMKDFPGDIADIFQWEKEQFIQERKRMPRNCFSKDMSVKALGLAEKIMEGGRVVDKGLDPDSSLVNKAEARCDIKEKDCSIDWWYEDQNAHRFSSLQERGFATLSEEEFRNRVEGLVSQKKLASLAEDQVTRVAKIMREQGQQ